MQQYAYQHTKNFTINGTVLANLPGDLIQLKSIDTGNTSGLEKSTSGVLSLKPRCKVIHQRQPEKRLSGRIRWRLLT